MKITLLFLIMLISFHQVSAQCIQFTYDAAGDRISRSICPEALLIDTNEKNDVKNVQAISYTIGDDIIIFPNPTDGIIQIQSSDGTVYESIMVSDILGRILVNKKHFSDSLDISHLQPGKYFVRVRQGDRSKVVMVIKQ